MARRPLTYKQARVLDLIETHIGTHDEAPTIEELRRKLRVKSLRTVTQYLDSLERKGYILRSKKAARNIALRDADSGGRGLAMLRVPVAASVGCDDLSVFAAEEADEYLEVDPALGQGGGDIVAVRAVGDSMQDAGIESGDYILIQFTDNVKSGDRVAAIIGDMVTVKRLERVSGGHGRRGLTVLWPESKDPKYKPIILREEFKIAGKVLCVIPNPQHVVTEVVPLEGYEHYSS
ncbi:MAG: transcriptional repressor LexA [Minisyncoccia bacterium]